MQPHPVGISFVDSARNRRLTLGHRLHGRFSPIIQKAEGQAGRRRILSSSSLSFLLALDLGEVGHHFG